MFKKTYLDIIPNNTKEMDSLKKGNNLISLIKEVFSGFHKKQKEICILGLVAICIVGGG